MDSFKMSALLKLLFLLLLLLLLLHLLLPCFFLCVAVFSSIVIFILNPLALLFHWRT